MHPHVLARLRAHFGFRHGVAMWASLLVLGALCMPPWAQAAPLAFSVEGVVLNNVLGYTPGQAVSFTYVLPDQRPLDVRVSPATPYPASACCSGQFGWSQDLPAQSHLWSAFSGTSLSGTWDPKANPLQRTLSALAISLGDQASQSLGLEAFDLAGTNAATGVTVQGLQVTGFQMQGVFKGLNALSVYGKALFSAPAPHPNDFFGGMVGTYLTDDIYTNRGTLWTLGGPSMNFRVTQLSISAVPEPGALAMGLVGAVCCVGWVRRHRPRPRHRH